jgi:hypothetical protein
MGARCGPPPVAGHGGGNTPMYFGGETPGPSSIPPSHLLNIIENCIKLTDERGAGGVSLSIDETNLTILYSMFINLTLYMLNYRLNPKSNLKFHNY